MSTAAPELLAPPARAAANSGRYTFVDALRGIAALAVFAHHVFYSDVLGSGIRSVVHPALQGLFDRGAFGVQVFFVISGFVIAHSLRATPTTIRAFGNFILRRHLRLDPPYWATVFILLILALVESRIPGVAHVPLPSAGVVVLNMLYLQNLTNVPHVLGVSWTLCLEVQFYLLFILLLGFGATVHRKTPQGGVSPLVITLLIASGMGSLALTQQQKVPVWEPAFFTWFLPFWSYFTAGALCSWAVDRRTGPAPFIAFAVLFAAAAIGFNLPEMTAGLVTVLALFAVGMAGRLTTWLNNGVIQYFGRVSYSLYLIHLPVITTLARIARKTNTTGPAATALWIVGACALTLIAAHLLHITVERPTMRLASRLKGRPVAPASVAETLSLPLVETTAAV